MMPEPLDAIWADSLLREIPLTNQEAEMQARGIGSAQGQLLIPNPDKEAQANSLVPAETYSPSALIEFLLSHPAMPQKDIAAHFGQGISWLATVVASDSYQQALDVSGKRDLILDPFFTATLEERFRALTLHSLNVLGMKLSATGVADATVLKAAEIGVKALGLGLPKQLEKPVEVEDKSVDRLAERLLRTLEKGRAGQVPANVIDVEEL